MMSKLFKDVILIKVFGNNLKLSATSKGGSMLPDILITKNSKDYIEEAVIDTMAKAVDNVGKTLQTDDSRPLDIVWIP
eukprot:9170338-Ditylum_brightwellii.AAC.2